MRAAAVVIAALVAGCASGGGPVHPGATTPVVLEGGSGGSQTIMLTRDPSGGREMLPVTSAAAWHALSLVFADLGLPVTTGDSVGGIVRSASVVRRIGKDPISRFFDCAGAYENLAATGFVSLDVESRVSGTEPEGASVATTIDAVARPLTGGGTVHCSARPGLYQLIQKRLHERLGLTAP